MNPTRISVLKTDIFDGVNKPVNLWSKIPLTGIQQLAINNFKLIIVNTIITSVNFKPKK